MNNKSGRWSRRLGLGPDGVLMLLVVASICTVSPVQADALGLLGSMRQSTVSVGDAIDEDTVKRNWYDGISLDLDIRAGINLVSSSSIWA